jgi:predicted RNA-binding Zn-ribbon protein involved in translation (DUF1610 family)
MRKPTKRAKSTIVKWHKNVSVWYMSEFQCPNCKTTWKNTLSKSNNITRFKCDCGQELIISKNLILNQSESR